MRVAQTRAVFLFGSVCSECKNLSGFATFVDGTYQLLNFQCFLAADGGVAALFHSLIEVGDLADMLEAPIVLASFIFNAIGLGLSGEDSAVVKFNAGIVKIFPQPTIPTLSMEGKLLFQQEFQALCASG